MRNLICFMFGMWTAGVTPAFAQDPLKIDPAHHKVELENEDVRVLRITFGPAEKAPAHDHPNSVAVFLSDGVNRLTTDGKSTATPQKHGGDPSTSPAAIDVIVVELKSGAGAVKK